MKKILLFVFVFSGLLANAQVTGTYNIKGADTVKIFKTGGFTELVLVNRTDTVPGFLFNKGGGTLIYKRALTKINSTTYLVGVDTLLIPSGGGSPGGPANAIQTKVGGVFAGPTTFLFDSTKIVLIQGTSNTINSGANYSAVIGQTNTLNGIYGLAVGVSNIVGANGFAFGNSNTASAYSISVGTNNSNTSNVSQTFGSGILNTYQNAMVIGAFNDTTSWAGAAVAGDISTYPVFQIGNGTNNGARSNAVTVLHNGKIILHSYKNTVGIDSVLTTDQNGNIMMKKYAPGVGSVTSAGITSFPGITATVTDSTGAAHITLGTPLTGIVHAAANAFTGSLIVDADVNNVGWSKLTGVPTTVQGFGITNAVRNDVVLANPSYIGSLAWTKITATPTTLQGYGITNSVRNDTVYNNPSFIGQLAYSKITGAPAFVDSVKLKPGTDSVLYFIAGTGHFGFITADTTKRDTTFLLNAGDSGVYQAYVRQGTLNDTFNISRVNGGLDIQIVKNADSSITHSLMVSQSTGNGVLSLPDGVFFPNVITNGLAFGGVVTWTGTGYVYNVSAAGYYINSVFYTSPAVQLTLPTADPTNDRLDAFVVNTSGAATHITGTPAGSPSLPAIDPATQLQISFALVEAASTTPTINTTCLYTENTEWTVVSSNTGRINPNGAATPCDGAKNIDATGVLNGDNISFTNPGGAFNPTSLYTVLTFVLRSKATWGAARGLRFQWRLASTNVGGSFTLLNGTAGFNSATLITCQGVSLPLTNFALPSGASVDNLLITAVGTAGTFGWAMDDLCMQGQPVTSPTTGLAQIFSKGLPLTILGTDTVAFPLGSKATMLTTDSITIMDATNHAFKLPKSAVVSGALTNGNGTTANGTAVDLGGSVTGNVIWAMSGFGMSGSGNINNALFSMVNANASGTGLSGSGGNTGVQGTSTNGQGVVGGSVNGYGLYSTVSGSGSGLLAQTVTGAGLIVQTGVGGATSSPGEPLSFTMNTNSSSGIIYLAGTNTLAGNGTPSVGIGEEFDWALPNTGGTSIAMKQTIVATNITSGTYAATYQLQLARSGSVTPVETITGVGGFQLNDYGQQSFSNTLSNFNITGILTEDANGNVKESRGFFVQNGTSTSITSTTTVVLPVQFTTNATAVFIIAPSLMVNSASGGSVTVTVQYFDASNTSRTFTMFSMGTTTAAVTALGPANLPSTGPIICKTGTSITVSYTVSGTINYDETTVFSQITNG